MSDTNDTTCSICACDVEEHGTTLDCGHTFHVSCIIQWFRYEHTSCPNCRSTHTRHVWTARSAAQRVAALRRRTSVSPYIGGLLKRLEKARKTYERVKTEQSTFNVTHRKFMQRNRELLSTKRRLQTRTYRSREHVDTLTEFIGTQVDDSTPGLMTYVGEFWDTDEDSEA